MKLRGTWFDLARKQLRFKLRKTLDRKNAFYAYRKVCTTFLYVAQAKQYVAIHRELNTIYVDWLLKYQFI